MNKSEIFVVGIFLTMLGLLVAIVVADAEKVMVKSIPYKDSNDSEYIYSESYLYKRVGGRIGDSSAYLDLEDKKTTYILDENRCVKIIKGADSK